METINHLLRAMTLFVICCCTIIEVSAGNVCSGGRRHRQNRRVADSRNASSVRDTLHDEVPARTVEEQQETLTVDAAAQPQTFDAVETRSGSSDVSAASHDDTARVQSECLDPSLPVSPFVRRYNSASHTVWHHSGSDQAVTAVSHSGQRDRSDSTVSLTQSLTRRRMRRSFSLLSSDASAKLNSHGQSKFHHMALLGDDEALYKFLQATDSKERSAHVLKNSDINLLDQYGNTFLYYCIVKNLVDSVQFFFNTLNFRYLIDCNGVNLEGKTLLDEALVSKASQEMITLLCAHGALPGLHFFHYAVEQSLDDYIQKVLELKKEGTFSSEPGRGFDINAILDEQTPLDRAIEKEHDDLACLLIVNGAGTIKYHYHRAVDKYLSKKIIVRNDAGNLVLPGVA